MSGRLENKIKREKTIDKLLKDMPDYVTDYYYHLSSGKESTSCLEYLRRIKRFLKYINDDIRSIDITQITEIDISKYLKSIETKIDREGNIKQASYSNWKQTHTVLTGFFYFLYKRNHISINPMNDIERIKKVDKIEHDFLSKEDIDKIIKIVETGAGSNLAKSMQKKWRSRDRAILLTFIQTGMRETALCEIDLDNIDFKERTLYVIDKGAKVNTYTMTDDLINAYKEWIEVRKILLKEKGESNNALFIATSRKRMTPQAVVYLVQKYTIEAIGKKVTPHRLRAAYGNLLLEKTNDIYFVSQAMKHASVETTKRYMENKEKEVNNRVANIMSEIF